MTDGAPSRSHGALLGANDDMTAGQIITREITALPRFFSTAQQRGRGSCRNDFRAGGRAPMRAAATMCPTRTKGARGPSGFFLGSGIRRTAASGRNCPRGPDPGVRGKRLTGAQTRDKHFSRNLTNPL